MSSSSRIRILLSTAVLLVLVCHSLALADDRKPWFKKEHFKWSGVGMELTDWGGSQHYRAPRHALGPDTVWSLVRGQWEDNDRDPTKTGLLEIHYYPRSGDARKIFDYMMEARRMRSGLNKARTKEGTRMISGVSEDSRLDNINHSALNGYTGLRVVLKGNYVIMIIGHGKFSGDQKFLTVFDALEKCGYEAIVKAGGILEDNGVVLKLEHVHPFAANIPSGRQGGDVVATVSDDKGEPLVGGEVVFSCKPGSPLARILELSHYHPRTRTSAGIEHDTAYMPAMDWSKVAVASLGSDGTAAINYLLDGHLRYWDLAQAVARNGKFRGTLYAFLLDMPHAGAYLNKSVAKTIARASIPLEFTCIARITRIASLDPDQKPLVRVKSDRPGFTGTRAVTPDMLPAELHVGDTILLDGNDFVDVEWLSGAKMEVRVKKDFLQLGQFAKFHIGHEDAGWYRQFDEWWHGRWAVVEIGAPGLIIGYFHTPAGAVHGTATLSFALFYSIGQEWDPLLITPHSKILIDFGEQVTLYTLEGRAELRHPRDGSITAVATGEKTTVSSRGRTIATPSTFDRYELSEALADVATNLDTMAAEAGSAAGSTRAPRGGVSTWLIVLIIILSVAVAGTIFFIVVRKRMTG